MQTNMRTARVLLGVCILSLSCFAANPPAQNDSVNKIIQAALQASSLQDNLRRLTDEIGGRVPGTPAMQHAVQWGMQAFTAAGAESVRTESFEIPYSWSEGNTEMTATTAHQISSGGVGGGTVLSSFRVRAVSVAWAPALALVKHVPVVDVGEGTDADFQKAGDISGKIALVHTTVLKKWADLFAEYANAPPIVDRAVKAKVKAIAFMATREHDILYRHTNSGAGEIDKLPMVIVAKEDGERIARLLAAGNLVWADLSIPDQVGGPIKSSNVIAEIRGRMREAQASVEPEPVRDYEFTTPDGPVRLSQLFGDKRDLFVIHNMGRSCPACTLWADGFNGSYPHIADRAFACRHPAALGGRSHRPCRNPAHAAPRRVSATCPRL